MEQPSQQPTEKPPVPPQDAETVPKKPANKQTFFAILEVDGVTSTKEIMIIQAANRSELKVKLRERDPNFKILAVIRGHQIQVSTSVALNFC